MQTIEDYYLSLYGEPERRAIFKSKDSEIEIYKWNEKQTDEGVTFYATSGASKKIGCEFFIGLTPEADDIATALADVAVTGNGKEEIPASGDSITLPYKLWGMTEMECFMFTDGDEILEPVEIDDHIVKFIQLVPLFKSELNFKIDHGEKALWEVFEENEVEYWNPQRTELVI